MKLADLATFARSRVGRVLMSVVGLAICTLLLFQTGPRQVWHAIVHAGNVLPIVFILEGAFCALEVLALRALYGLDRHKLPPLEVAHAGIVAYAVAGLMPAGRPVAEGVRGAMLARYTSGARAAAAGTKLQAVMLITQAAVCIPCAIAALVIDAPLVLPIALGINGIVTATLGSAVTLATRRTRIGEWIAKKFPRASAFGPAFDTLIREESVPLASWVFAASARLVQILQYSILLVAFTGHFELVRGLCGEGVHLVGASIGDFIPSHLGGTETMFAINAQALGLSPSAAVAIPLAVHAEQMLWVVVCLLLPLLWPRTAPSPSIQPVSPTPQQDGGAR